MAGRRDACATLLRNTHPIKIRAAVRGGGVKKTRRAGLTDDVAGQTGEGRLGRKVGGALEKVASRARALPLNENPPRVVDGRHHSQDRLGVGWIGIAAPLLPVVHAVVVGVGIVHRAIVGQTVLLEPSVRNG